MTTADVIRKVQRSIGDSNEILITKADIVDWINEGQREIARETLYRTTSGSDTAANFISGKAVSDIIVLERVYYDTKPLALLDKETIDRMDMQTYPDGIAVGYYMLGDSIYLFPTPEATDSTTVTYHYVDNPTELADENSSLDLPARYEDDLTNYCRRRANERNENYRAAEYYQKEFEEGLAQRKFEGQSKDDSFHTIGPDYSDYEDLTYYDRI